ncbi:MAG: polyribonucleotide nucleotidyltransferase [Spirochaetales bacterium]|nr:polyribonucleotide nucleotidyltransferase [Spirochaetales bacterium]
MQKKVSIRVGEYDLTLETGRMAKQANGAVYASYANCGVLATVCCSLNPVENLDYVPLQVEYNEKFYAAGKIPGGFLRREGRPKDSEILVSRLIDRPMRPLFSKKFKREIQVVPTVISADMINPPDVVAMVAASAAVAISDIPFDGPVGAVRVAQLDGQYIVNPTFDQIEKSSLDIIVSGTEEGITMVEGGAQEVSEEALLGAIETASVVIAEICKAQKELAAVAGKEKLPMPEETVTLSAAEAVRSFALPLMADACFVKGKEKRAAAIRKVKADTVAHFDDTIPDEEKGLLEGLFEEIETQVVRRSIIDNKLRTDGRGLEDIRPISCEIGVLPCSHGSALFTRGETQALAVTTLGTISDERLIDDIEGEKRYESFMLHYNFPPFSVGETGRLGTGRREIGHGHLAERAIKAILPDNSDFPYTIRIVSEILESNGSSSMASVCGGSLSLFDAGVPVKKAVAGIAMGLITDKEETVVLSDILGEEDHLGDMDFKVAGTADGITAFQMDIKISGVSTEIMSRALEQARRGRLHILKIMNDLIPEPAADISSLAPRIISFMVDQEKIGAIIGPGGKNIKAVSEASKASINIDDDGKVLIFGKDMVSAKTAENMIKGIIEEPEIGKIYNGTVRKIMEFGAFIEFLPGKDGLCHISKLSRERVNAVEEVLKVGQQIPVKLIEIDRMGRMNLSYIDAIDPDGERKPREGDRGPADRQPNNRERSDGRSNRGGDRR